MAVIVESRLYYLDPKAQAELWGLSSAGLESWRLAGRRNLA